MQQAGEGANQLRASSTSGSGWPCGEFPAARRTCAVTGLSHVRPEETCWAPSLGEPPMLAPVLAYGVGLARGADNHAVLLALRELAEEDPMLGVAWDERCSG